MTRVGLSRLLLISVALFVCCNLPDYHFIQPEVSSCTDGVRNGEESDADCGGNTCEKCRNGKACRQASDCVIGNCTEKLRCEAAHCTDSVLSPEETDVDCGGPECSPCGVHQHCEASTDCTSNVCVNGECVATGCDNDVTDGPETDLNCGGGTCPACRIGRRCDLGGDCESGICLAGLCSTEACGNGTKEPNEQGVDCGGACPKVCDAAANCSNNRKSELETDVDCGGGTCRRCADTLACKVNADCASDSCANGVCVTPCVGTACDGDGTGGAGNGAAGAEGEGGSPSQGGTSQGGVSALGGTSAKGGTSSSGASGVGGTAQGGGGTSTGGSGGTAGTGMGGTGMGGTLASGGASGGMSMGGSGGAPTMFPEPTCSGCARLSVPLAAATDKANFAITLPYTMNFSNAVVTMRVYRQAGSGGQFKGYVQHSGSPDYLQLFQDPPFDVSSLTGWQTLTWNVGEQRASYDKSNVGRVGLQITALASTSWTNPTVIYVDSISVSGISGGPWTFDNNSSVSTSPSTSGPPNVLFCNSGDNPVSGARVSWYSR